MRAIGLALLAFVLPAFAQEAESGFELRSTLSGTAAYSELLSQPPRNGESTVPGFRAMFYPTWKLNSRWAISGAVQVYSRPYFAEQFTTQGAGVKGDILQLNLSYARFWERNRSIVVRLGQLSSAFGAFLQRYDSAQNPLIGIPTAYGYYYKPITFLGLVGAQIDATADKLDARVQFVNASPANRRSIFDHDQYGNWAGGLGYSIRQGFRAGGSIYHGPYLHRQHRFYRPNEAKPRDLAGTGYGLDISWARGHWNAWGEWQHFRMDYRAVPVVTQHTGYAEVRRVLSPRWYVASRAGYLRASAFAGSQTFEFAGGYRPGVHHLIKFGYAIQQGKNFPGTRGNIAAVEYVTSFRALSIARD